MCDIVDVSLLLFSDSEPSFESWPPDVQQYVH